MGIFTFGYLALRAWTMNQAIGQRLEAGRRSIRSAGRRWNITAKATGLLNAKSFAFPKRSSGNRKIKRRWQTLVRQQFRAEYFCRTYATSHARGFCGSQRAEPEHRANSHSPLSTFCASVMNPPPRHRPRKPRCRSRSSSKRNRIVQKSAWRSWILISTRCSTPQLINHGQMVDLARPRRQRDGA